MLMQEKETKYKGGIMAFVHTYFTGSLSNLVLKRRNGTWFVLAPYVQHLLLMVKLRQNGSDDRHNGHEYAWPR
jgi:hypothetical protein